MYKVEGAALSVFFYIYIRVVFCQICLRSILRFGMPSKIQKYKERCSTTWRGGRGGEREKIFLLSYLKESKRNLQEFCKFLLEQVIPFYHSLLSVLKYVGNEWVNYT